MEETRRSNESEDEMRRYNYHKPYAPQYIQPQPMAYASRSLAPADLYYCGVLQLDPVQTFWQANFQNRVNQILTALPPPQEFATLKPMERAAYLFYANLHRCHFQPVAAFHARFNHQFYGYTCQGMTEQQALTKVRIDFG